MLGQKPWQHTSNVYLSLHRKVKSYVQARLNKVENPLHIAYAGFIIPWVGLTGVTRDRFMPPSPAPTMSQAVKFSTHGIMDSSPLKSRHYEVKNFSIETHGRRKVKSRAGKGFEPIRLRKLSVMQAPSVYVENAIGHAVDAAVGPWQNQAQLDCKAALWLFGLRDIEASKAAGLSPEEAANKAFKTLGGNNSAQQFSHAHTLLTMDDTASCAKAERAGLTSEFNLWIPFYRHMLLADPRFDQASNLFARRYGLFVNQNDVNFMVSCKYASNFAS